MEQLLEFFQYFDKLIHHHCGMSEDIGINRPEILLNMVTLANTFHRFAHNQR